MNILSLFDGMSCGRVALERAGVPITKYYASEIDKYATKVSNNNYPNIVRLGDINNKTKSSQFWQRDNLHSIILPPIDLIIGGSPCQGFSFAGKQLAFDDPRSKLFFKFVEILNYYKPKYFLLENVRMKKEHQDIISKCLGVEPICINSSLVSAQNRVRYYWTSIPNVTQPQDKKINPVSILEIQGIPASSNRNKDGSRVVTAKDSFNCLTASYYKGVRANSRPGVLISEYYNNRLYDDLYPKEFRMLTPMECERLQTLPDNYTQGVSNTQRYKCLGNGWTVDVLAHIFKGLL